MADLPTPDHAGQPCTGPDGHVPPILRVGVDVLAVRLRRSMEVASADVWAKAATLGVSLRRSAFALAVERVAEAIAARGIFP